MKEDLKQEVIEAVERIDSPWILRAIQKFVCGMTKGTEYEYIQQDNTQE